MIASPCQYFFIDFIKKKNSLIDPRRIIQVGNRKSRIWKIILIHNITRESEVCMKPKEKETTFTFSQAFFPSPNLGVSPFLSSLLHVWKTLWCC
jgi:hypothetical protein